MCPTECFAEGTAERHHVTQISGMNGGVQGLWLLLMYKYRQIHDGEKYWSSTKGQKEYMQHTAEMERTAGGLPPLENTFL